ncbi:glycosyltransferase [Geofilum rubicundum]|uniref:Glycosyltransferase in Chlorophyll a cluster n=1 Tax=Geofilum rubicundum JCM 15548 TaxID=1236989 RepID=A0A0E9M1U2_9BACT|nr:glycosyltransferase [Geofilum rubicundum]GAO31449.1 glycosyltransferase in Chlorophyll a cluster [Geofilum rubicundum JCM 15548]
MDVGEIISWVFMAMLLLRFGVVLVNWATPVHLSDKLGLVSADSAPLVSILIPARNEAHNLPSLLSDIKKLDYPHLEVLVCNDHSTDGTPEVLKEYAADWAGLNYFDSDPLPEGWMGKNFACHQLAQRASGDWLLFLDADVRLKRDAICRALADARRKGVSLLSVFPQQIMKTKGERQTVPVMNWILLSMLPLVAVRLPWFSALAAANGQFMLFEASVYRRHEWHRQVWNQNVDDIVIARTMKRQGQSIVVLTGDEDVLCRMYTTREEAIQGFARNMHHFFGGHRLWMTWFVILAWIRMPYFALAGHWWFLAASVLMVVGMKMGVAVISRQSIKMALFLHYGHLWSMTGMALTNLRNRKQVIWKGRIYKKA